AALGPNGMLQEALGVDRLPSIYGFTGAWLVLTLFTYPLVLIPLRATLRRIDPQLEDAARAMGRGPFEVFRTVVLPQLWPVLAPAGPRLLLADRHRRLRAACRRPRLLGLERDLHRQHLAEHDRRAWRQLAADRGLGGGDRGDRGADRRGAGGALPVAGQPRGRAPRPRRLRAARDPRRPRPRLLRDAGGAGALPDDRPAGLRDDDPLPAAGDRPDRQLP